MSGLIKLQDNLLLSIHNLHKSYGIRPILQNINFNISAGERIGLIGPNGSGKTALMRSLVVVHDRYFIERFASEVWLAKDGKIIR